MNPAGLRPHRREDVYEMRSSDQEQVPEPEQSNIGYFAAFLAAIIVLCGGIVTVIAQQINKTKKN
ncbi:MHC class II antigen K [Caenorhabditis elegans]|uniref:MHC class II antigen K n=1 Tax=Caenorhabditis elegans TaxID=6239 RepID=O61757_CAEEL|nr:MHC class II antigen K [Caenorhabditis elegans]CCD69812.1 MHC class II antigen K [Caenorhabditis elegans]|eukprot:NP_508254.1 Uncharacterized protein CELE_F56C3.7 [Caenorhabditis elegans]